MDERETGLKGRSVYLVRNSIEFVWFRAGLPHGHHPYTCGDIWKSGELNWNGAGAQAFGILLKPAMQRRLTRGQCIEQSPKYAPPIMLPGFRESSLTDAA